MSLHAPTLVCTYQAEAAVLQFGARFEVYSKPPGLGCIYLVQKRSQNLSLVILKIFPFDQSVYVCGQSEWLT